MRVTGWHNGGPERTKPAGYGVRLAKSDCDGYFRQTWPAVTVELGNGRKVTVRLTGTFWTTCHELRSAEIGRWLLDEGLAPWTRGHPPALNLERTADRVFRLTR
jgi:hypothetical protein